LCVQWPHLAVIRSIADFHRLKLKAAMGTLQMSSYRAMKGLFASLYLQKIKTSSDDISFIEDKMLTHVSLPTG